MGRQHAHASRRTLSALSDASAEFLLVGAHAVAVHGWPRATGNLDVWVNPPSERRESVASLASFGAPMNHLTSNDLAQPGLVFQIGVVPDRIDILTSVTGLEFEDAWERRVIVRFDDVEVPVIGLSDLIHNKRAVGRARDLADLEGLEGGD